jgi:hypothetical protein
MRRAPPRGQRLKTFTLPAPNGGLNTLAPGGALPATDWVYAWNILNSELGVRVRNGYREWVTGMTGATDNLVRSIIPFTGGRKNGSTDKIFATTSTGIWDCTASSAAPTQVWEFSTQTGEAGYGTSTIVTTPGDRYLIYCDEENGVFVYTESTTSWTQMRAGATVAWAAATAYTAGNLVVNGANAYVCTVAGVSAGAGGPTGQGVGIVDNTVTWKFYEGAWTALQAYALGCTVTNGVAPKRLYVCTTAGNAAGAGGPSGTGTAIADGTCVWNYVAEYTPPVGQTLSDQQLGFPGTPIKFVQAVVWKSRLFFVEKDSSRGWYMPVNSVYGTASSFDFGVRMRAGGELKGLYNWSYDAGNGIDALLVGISGSGDVVIYQGTDPSSVNTFGLKGTWSVGAVPYGRRLATDFGGDLLVMSLLGLVPLSKLVLGQPTTGGDRSVYVTDKVSNFFALAAQTNRLLQGWQVLQHPAEGALMLLIPTEPEASCTPLVMSFSNRSWWPYRDLPIYSAQSWQGQLYFGTTDGRLCWYTGYVDGVTLADPNAYAPIRYSGLTGFSNLGNARQKRVQLSRPTVLAQTGSVVKVTPRYRFNTAEPPPPSAALLAGPTNVWDTAIWDTDVWGGDFVAIDRFSSGGGVGRDVALAIQGLAISRTILASVDVFYEEGGLL